MNLKKEKNRTFKIVPKNENKCVWMEAGIVTYKICDRNFACDTCPLDKGLRGSDYENIIDHQEQKTQHFVNNKTSFSRGHSSSLEKLIKYKLDEHCYVHPGHSWIKVQNKNRVKIGIDDIVATTLGFIDDVILPLPGEKIKRGASCGQIIQFEHIFSIVSPLSGWVETINKDLASFPNNLTLDPLNKGWMLIIKPENLEQDLKYSRSGDALYSWYLKEFKWFEGNLAKGFRQEHENIGLTLHDGGEISRNLRNYLPKDHYRRLVLNLLGLPESSE